MNIWKQSRKNEIYCVAFASASPPNRSDKVIAREGGIHKITNRKTFLIGKTGLGNEERPGVLVMRCCCDKERKVSTRSLVRGIKALMLQARLRGLPLSQDLLWAGRNRL